MVREPILARMRIGSAVGVSIVLSILYGELDSNFEGINSTISLLLFTMVFLALTSALPVVLSVLPEIHVTQKEVRNCWYRPTSYVRRPNSSSRRPYSSYRLCSTWPSSAT